MATYKVIQDIEAEDHILGPLSLRQFIYGLIAVFLLYICFICLTKGVGFLVAVFLPPALFCAFFAFPFGKDQPTEIWALAKIRFYLKPRKRLWNQSGVKELVTITVPKKVEVQLTDGLSQTEVRSRLRALADTIDSRGWAIKNMTPGSYTNPLDGDSERLLSLGSIPRPVPEFEEGPDVLDERTSPLAQQFTSMMDASARSRREQLMQQLSMPAPAVPQPAATPQWFSQPAMPAPQTIVAAPPAQAATPTTDEAAISEQIQTRLAAQAQANARLRTIPAPQNDATAAPTSAPPQVAQPVTPPADPAILNLAKNNDLNVATLAREAKKTRGLDDEEVVISLH